MNIENFQLKNLLLFLAGFFIISGTSFFLELNWAEIHKFLKLIIIPIFIIITLFIYIKYIKNKLITNIALWIAIVSIGIEFLIFNNVYKTGANSYEFFLAWSIFSFGLVFISNSSINWFTYLIILNFTLFLYLSEKLNISMANAISINIIFNLLTTTIFYMLVRKNKLLHLEWLYKLNFIYLIYLLVYLFFSLLIFSIKFSNSFFIYLLFIMLYLAVLYFIYKKEDTLLKNVAILSLIIIISIFFGYIFGSYGGIVAFFISLTIGLFYVINKNIKQYLDLGFKYSLHKTLYNAIYFLMSVAIAMLIQNLGGIFNIITPDNGLIIGIILLIASLSKVIYSKNQLSINLQYIILITIMLSQMLIYDNVLSTIFSNNALYPLIIIAILQIPLFILISDYKQRVMSIALFILCIAKTSDLSAVIILLICLFFIIILNDSNKISITVNLNHDNLKLPIFNFEKELVIKSLKYGINITIFIIIFILSSSSIENSTLIIFQFTSLIFLYYIIFEYFKSSNILLTKTMIIVIFILSLASTYILFLNAIFLLLLLSFIIKSTYLKISSFIGVILLISPWFNLEFYESISLIVLGIGMVLTYYFIKIKENICEE